MRKKDPHPDIKLPSCEQQRPLHVLLHYERVRPDHEQIRIFDLPDAEGFADCAFILRFGGLDGAAL